jgi:hypothetical protein
LWVCPPIPDLRAEIERLSEKTVSLRNRYLLDIAHLIPYSLVSCGDVQIEAMARKLYLEHTVPRHNM